MVMITARGKSCVRFVSGGGSWTRPKRVPYWRACVPECGAGKNREYSRCFAAGSRAHLYVCIFSSVVKNLQNLTRHCLLSGRKGCVCLSGLAYFKVSDEYLDKHIPVCDPNV